MTEVAWPRSQTAVEQSLFRVPVVLHRLVIVEMVAREIGKNRDRVFEFVTTMKIHCLRRTFHHRRATSDLDGASQAVAACRELRAWCDRL